VTWHTRLGASPIPSKPTRTERVALAILASAAIAAAITAIVFFGG
jgi:hypothetical protein